MTYKYEIVIKLVHAESFSKFDRIIIISISFRSPVFSQISYSSIPMSYIRVAEVALSE